MKNRIMNFPMLAAIFLGFAAFNPAHADVIALDAVDSGYYERHYASFGVYSTSHDPVEREYSVRYFDQHDPDDPGLFNHRTQNNFFVFDLSGITQVIESATIILTRGMFGYDSTSSITYGLYDVECPARFLVTGGYENTEGVLGEIFSDLGDGSQFGNYMVDNSTPDVISIELNASAVTSINNAIGSLWSLGGKIDEYTRDGIDPDDIINVELFGATGETSIMRLKLQTVPDPSAVFLLGSACLIGCAGLRRKYNK